VRVSGTLILFVGMMDSEFVGSTGVSFIASAGVPREQKMLKGHLPRVIYRQVY